MKKKVATTAAIVILSTAFASGVSANTHTVQKGETLSHIAIKYSTSVGELKRINQLNSDLIRIQQVLKVSESTSSSASASASAAAPVAPAAPAVAVQTPAPASVKTYTVVSGDTLSKIASRHGITLANLMSWNNLTGHLIYPGDVLKVSAGTTSTTPVTSAPAAPAPVPTPSTPAQPTAPAVTIPNVTEYVVISGDTLGHISSKFGTTVANLKALNNLNSDIIYVGQKLKVTAQAASPSQPVVTTPVSNPQTPAVSVGTTALLNQAKALIGTPYLWGGTTPAGFDCSGFIYYVFNKAGKQLSRLNAEGYYNRSYYVHTPEPGDLIFFENTYKKGISHLGIYLGNNQFIHADSSGVRITDVNNAYYKQHFEGYKRFY